MQKRLRLVLAVLFVVGGGGATFAAPPAGAECTLPTLSVDPAQGPPDTQITVTGKGFQKDCTTTTTGPDSGDTGVKLTFEQNGNVWDIGTVTRTDPRGDFTVRVYVPNGDGVNEGPSAMRGKSPSPGAATVKATGTTAAATDAFEVTPGPSGTTTTTRRPTTTTAKPATTATTSGRSTSTTAATAAKSTTTTETTTTETTETTDTTRPVITVDTTSTTQAALPLRVEDDEDNRGPWIALALVLLASVVGTVAWRSWRSI